MCGREAIAKQEKDSPPLFRATGTEYKNSWSHDILKKIATAKWNNICKVAVFCVKFLKKLCKISIFAESYR